MKSSTLDALVIGGGPSGGAAAILLAQAGWSVGVVEKASFPRHKVCGEFLSATNFALLRQMGVADAFFALAGPAVTRVGLFSRDHMVTSAMPGPPGRESTAGGSGRALGREHLDTMLLNHAAAIGATVWQPWSAVNVAREGEGYLCTAIDRVGRRSIELRARVVIAAHGSWEAGSLATQWPRAAPQPSDLFGFKAHFLDSRLPDGLMPLLVFPGGYGGMVHSDQGRVSLSCCIRRDQLHRVRRAAGPVKAADAVLGHIRKSCRGVDDALTGARLEHEWQSAGPIRPGIRHQTVDGAFLVGNAAGEAHPAIAEGIGMAMQSAAQLCRRLTAAPLADLSRAAIEATGRDYATAWHRALGSRIKTGSLIANWALTPAAVACGIPMLRLVPGGLTACAWLSGKAVSTS